MATANEKAEAANSMKGPEGVLAITGLTYHAWGPGNNSIALSANDNDITIYNTDGNMRDPSKWKPECILDGHSGFVSGIDWSPVTNLIVTCGHDRNAYVWKQDENKEWTPTLVILRINRAATAVRWSPAGNKFAVTSGAKCVPVCHFEESNNWWISKMIKKHKSTVNCLDWCPNNKFIVTGACDFKARICSAYIKGIDSPDDDGFGAVWKKQHEFGEVLAEFEQAHAWVQAVAWSPNGFRIAFGGHGSSIHFVQILAGAKPVCSSLELDGLPHLDMTFLSDNVVLAVGFDRNPQTFAASGDAEDPKWAKVEDLDKQQEEKKGADAKPKGPSAFGNARQLFAASADQGTQFGAKVKEDSIWTRHTNTIISVRKIGEQDGKTTSLFSTAGVDGRLLFWDLTTLDCDKKTYGL